jgi:hypothetical protein
VALQKIVIEVGGKTDLDSTIKQLQQLGLIDEQNAKDFQKNSKTTQQSLDQTNNKLGALSKVASNIGPALAGAFAVSQIVSFGNAVIRTTAQFQKFEAVLVNTLGSRSEAQKALREIKDFAASTPFSVAELTESFVKLANQGFKPTREEMRKLGDLAASTGKTFDMLTEAIIDAQTGEFERLKEFGIRASKEGDKVKFTFKGVQTQTEFTSEAIRKYILGLGDLQGVSGSMAAISKTLGGQISNLGDAWDGLLVAIGGQSGGIFSVAIDLLGMLVGSVTDLVKAGDSATESWREQSDMVQNLEENVVPLIDRYEELSTKSSLSKAEQDELDKIIVKIGEDIPTAITQFDEYGKAIGISTEEARKFVDQQKAILAIKNKEAIDEQTEALEKLNIKIRAYQRELKEGTKLSADMDGTAISIKLTGEEIKNLQKGLADLQFQKVGVVGLLNELKGIKPVTEKNTEAIKEQFTTIESLKKKVTELTAEREKTNIVDLKKINSLNAEIKQTQELIRQLEGQDAATKKLNKEREEYNKAMKKYEEITKDLSGVTFKAKEAEDKTEKERLKAIKDRLNQKHKQNKEYFDGLIKLSSDSNKKISEDEAKSLEKTKEARQQAVEAAFAAFTDITNALFENSRIREENEMIKADKADEAELERLEKRKRNGKISEEALSAAKEAIQKKSEQREREFRRRQAEQEKKQALFNIAVNTAQGVLKAIATFGPPPSPAGIVGIATALATGAIQGAIVASRPLPEFYEGGHTGKGRDRDVAGIVHKNEFVMPAEKTRRYREVLDEMYNGTYEKGRLPIISKKSLTDARNEGMAENLYKSLILNGGFSDSRIVKAIQDSTRSEKSDRKLADRIIKGISDRAEENRLFA